MEIGLFFAGAIIGLLIAHLYYRKSTNDLKAELRKLKEEIRPLNTIQDFENMLDSASWQEETVDHCDVWICNSDNTFQIVRGIREEDRFAEPWTQLHPDVLAAACPIYLKINGIVVKQMRFVSVDSGRIFVPIPEVRTVEGKSQYFWRTGSLEFKVGKVVGSYYIYNDMFGVAKRSKIEVVTE